MNNACYLCESNDLKKREGKVRDNDSLEIFECKNCGLVFLSSFEHIDENFYETSQMHSGIEVQDWIDFIHQDNIQRGQKHINLIEDKNILDFGCGPADFLAMANNLAKDVVGIELDLGLREHFEKENLKVFSSINDLANNKFDTIFMFPVLEHIKNPIELLENFKNILNKDGKVVIEVPNSDDALLTLYKNKAFSEFTYWSPHLFSYNEKSLKLLLKKAGFKVIKIDRIQRYSLKNHLNWIFKGSPNGIKFENILIDKIYACILRLLKKTDTIT